MCSNIYRAVATLEDVEIVDNNHVINAIRHSESKGMTFDTSLSDQRVFYMHMRIYRIFSPYTYI